MDGAARVIAPGSKMRWPRALKADAALPAAGAHFRRLLDAARRSHPIRTAVVHPCDAVSLVSAMEAMEARLIVPILVGPIAKIRKVAAEAGRALEGIEILDVPHSHAAAERAVALGREAKVDALMKGALHTDELMAAVIDSSGGLRTERRMSHVFALDVPHHREAGVHHRCGGEHCAQPRLQARHHPKRARPPACARHRIAEGGDLVGSGNGEWQDAIDHRCGRPVQDSERGQIVGGVLDGPLAFDNAISSEAARNKGISSPWRGRSIFSWCPISRQAICWSSSSSIWPAPRPRASCWGPACRSSSRVGRTATWRDSRHARSRHFGYVVGTK